MTDRNSDRKAKASAYLCRRRSGDRKCMKPPATIWNPPRNESHNFNQLTVPPRHILRTATGTGNRSRRGFRRGIPDRAAGAARLEARRRKKCRRGPGQVPSQRDKRICGSSRVQFQTPSPPPENARMNGPIFSLPRTMLTRNREYLFPLRPKSLLATIVPESPPANLIFCSPSRKDQQRHAVAGIVMKGCVASSGAGAGRNAAAGPFDAGCACAGTPLQRLQT